MLGVCIALLWFYLAHLSLPPTQTANITPEDYKAILEVHKTATDQFRDSLNFVFDLMVTKTILPLLTLLLGYLFGSKNPSLRVSRVIAPVWSPGLREYIGGWREAPGVHDLCAVAMPLRVSRVELRPLRCAGLFSATNLCATSGGRQLRNRDSAGVSPERPRLRAWWSRLVPAPSGLRSVSAVSRPASHRRPTS
jgi:hypothetical protein